MQFDPATIQYLANLTTVKNNLLSITQGISKNVSRDSLKGLVFVSNKIDSEFISILLEGTVLPEKKEVAKIESHARVINGTVIMDPPQPENPVEFGFLDESVAPNVKNGMVTMEPVEDESEEDERLPKTAEGLKEMKEKAKKYIEEKNAKMAGKKPLVKRAIPKDD